MTLPLYIAPPLVGRLSIDLKHLAAECPRTLEFGIFGQVAFNHFVYPRWAVTAEANFVYRAWLQAGGAFTFVREHVLAWIRINGLERDAVYLLKYVTKQRDLPHDVVLTILGWCRDFSVDPDAIWRLSTLTKGITPDSAGAALEATEAVFEPILTNQQLDGLTRSQVTTVLGDLSRLEPLRTSPALVRIVLRWLNHSQSIEPTRSHGPHHQNREFLSLLVAAIESSPEPTRVTHLLRWIGVWDENERVFCSDLVTRLRLARREDVLSYESLPAGGRGRIGNSTDLELWRLLGVGSRSTGGQHAAAALVEKALRENELVAEDAFGFVSEVRSTAPDAARSVLEAMVSALPGNAKYWNMLSVVQRDLRQFDQSLDASSRATTLAPAEPTHWYALGRTHEVIGNWDQAEAAFNEALRLRAGSYPKAEDALSRIRVARDGLSTGADRTSERPKGDN